MGVVRVMLEHKPRPVEEDVTYQSQKPSKSYHHQPEHYDMLNHDVLYQDMIDTPAHY